MRLFITGHLIDMIYGHCMVTSYSDTGSIFYDPFYQPVHDNYTSSPVKYIVCKYHYFCSCKC